MSEFPVGGPANIAGIDYQLSFTVLKLIDAWYNPELKVSPEAIALPQTDGSPQLISVDDITVDNGKEQIHYNVKRAAPSGSSGWKINDLISQGVVRQFRKQLTQSKSLVRLVSSSHVELGEVFNRLKEARHESEIANRLNQKQCEVWTDAIRAFEFSERDLLEYSKRMYFECRHLEDITSYSLERLENSFDRRAHDVLDSLYQFAKEAAKYRKHNISKDDIQLHLAERGHFPSIPTTIQKAKDQFFMASATLREAKIGFGTFDRHHIPRDETEKVFQWIQSELPENFEALALLTGSAGKGKTVIMRDLLRRLESNSIPTLALKADDYVDLTIEEVERRLDISPGVVPLAGKFAQDSTIHRVVVLIDQLDALSLSLTTNRKPIESYWSLIARLLSMARNNQAIRIVVSCREYDLQTDPDLKKLSPAITEKVKLLKEAEVKKVLEKVGVQFDSLSKKMQGLLAVPLHLDVYASLLPVPEIEIESLEGLYNQFWMQKVAARGKGSIRAEQLLFHISDEMLKRNILSVKRAVARSFESELSSLSSAGILVADGGHVRFFHQTFFDYAIARVFVQSGQGLQELIIEQHQGLFLRPRIKMLLQYLRSCDARRYEDDLRWILKSPDVRFHILRIAIDLLAWQSSPSGIEREIWVNIIWPEPKLRWAFIRAINSPVWAKTIIQRGEMITMIKEVADNRDHTNGINIAEMLIRSQEGIEAYILKLLDKVSDSEMGKEIGRRFLWGLQNWDFEIALHLVVKLRNYFSVQWPQMLSKIAPFHTNWAIDQYREYFLDGLSRAEKDENKVTYLRRYFDLNSPGNGQAFLFLQKIAELDPQSTLGLLLFIFDEVTIEDEPRFLHPLAPKQGLVGGSYFLADDSYSLPTQEKYTLFGLIRSLTSDLSKQYPDHFRKHFDLFISRKHRELYLALIIAFAVNQEHYHEEIFQLFNLLFDYHVWYEESELNAAAIELAALSVPKMSQENMSRFLRLVNSFKDPRYTTAVGEKEKYQFLKYNGSHQYRVLKRFSSSDRAAFPGFQKRYLELARKFKEPESISPIIYSGWGKLEPPFSAEKMARMSTRTFLRSALNPDTYKEDVSIHRGGLTAVASELRAAGKIDPEKVALFVRELVRHGGKEELLVYGMRGLVDAKFTPSELEPIFMAAFPIVTDTGALIMLIDVLAYLLENEICNTDLIAIIWVLTNHHDPTPSSSKEDLGFGIDTVRGSIANAALPRLVNFPQYAKETFSIALRLASDHSVGVKAALVDRLGQLTRLDRDRTFEIFRILVQHREPEVIEFSANLLNYWTHFYWDEIRVFLQSIMSIESIQDNWGRILYFSAEAKRSGAEELLDEGSSKYPKILSGAIHAALNQLEKSDENLSSENPVQFISGHVSRWNRDDEGQINFSFHHFDPENFAILRPILEEYIGARNHNTRFDGVVRYLKEASRSYPHQVLEVISWFKEQVDTTQFHIHEFRDLPGIILNCYHALREYTNHNEGPLVLALDLIDWLGEHPIFDRQLAEVLDNDD